MQLATKHAANAQEVRVPAIILTHDCALDNDPDKSTVLLGLVRPLKGLDGKIASTFRSNTRSRALYLPASEYLEEGESYLDLRRITTIQKGLLAELVIVASMNENGRLMLREQLVRFFTHKVLPAGWADWEEDAGGA